MSHKQISVLPQLQQGIIDGIYSNQNNSKIRVAKKFFSILNMLWFILGQIVGQVVREKLKTYTLPYRFHY
jgi:hypothetical protein